MAVTPTYKLPASPWDGYGAASCSLQWGTPLGLHGAQCVRPGCPIAGAIVTSSRIQSIKPVGSQWVIEAGREGGEDRALARFTVITCMRGGLLKLRKQ